MNPHNPKLFFTCLFFVSFFVSCALFSQTPDTNIFATSGIKADSIPLPHGISYAMVDSQHIIYENTMVYYGYNFSSRTAENAYNQSKKLTRRFFRMIRKINFGPMIGKKCNPKTEEERKWCKTLEWNNKGKKIKVTWYPGDDDSDSMLLNKIADEMERFW